MPGELRFEAGRVVKSFGTAAEVARLINRTRRLIAAGVPTPMASPGPGPAEATFPNVQGKEGLVALANGGVSALQTLLAPLAPLHRANLTDLPDFDPLLRIRPRIGAGDDAVAAAARNGAAAIARHTAGRPLKTIHGDFHFGQVIVTPDGGAQLLDLDDLAHGPIEADLGNFAAHLASRPEFNADSVRVAMGRWLSATISAYDGVAADSDLAEAIAHVALLRRGLKLRERDGDDSVLRAAVTICEDASNIS